MKTVSLELAKQLREAGYPEEEGFYYVDGYLWDETAQSDYETNATPDRSKWVYAPTAEEILEQLPKRMMGHHPLWYLTIHCNDKYYSLNFETFNGKIQKDFGARAESLAEAAGKMWLYLKENNLL